ncbi:MAG: DNA repair protein RecO [Eubacteriaceae bacterium]
MALEKASGIVIKKTNLGDNDLIITIFTKEKGKIQVVAKGAKKVKSKFIGSTQLFSYSNFVYYTGKSFNYLSQSELIESFYNIRKDLEKLSVATYLIEIINLAFEEEDKDERVLNLVLYSLNTINRLKIKSSKYILLAYQLKMMGLMGYAPNLHHCSKCLKEYEEYFFSIETGGVICKECKGQDLYSNIITVQGIDLMKTLLFYPIKKINEISYNDDLLKYLIKIMNKYIVYHIDRKIISYDFMETI